MAKRFTDTEKWTKPFVRSLPAKYKLLWFYITDRCDHSGIWQADFEVAQIYIGETITMEEALSFFKDKVVPFCKGEKWFIPAFIEFQYGELNEANRAHGSVIKNLRRHNLIDGNNKVLTSPLQGRKDKDKDMDMDKDSTKNNRVSGSKSENSDSLFDQFWNEYDKKIGKPNAIREWKKLTESEKQAAIKAIPAYKFYKKEVAFRKDPERYLKYKVWNDEIPIETEQPQYQSTPNSQYDSNGQKRIVV